MSENQLTFGLQNLDRQIDDGIPYPSLVTLTSKSDINSELILETLIEHNQPVFYITTHKSKLVVESIIDNSNTLPDVDELSLKIFEADLESPIDKVQDILQSAPNEPSFMIIDSVDALERKSPNRYRNLLITLQEYAHSSQSCVLLYGLTDTVPTNRSMTNEVSDVIFNVFEVIEGGNEVETFMLIKKNRFGSAEEEPIKIKLEAELEIDTSRAIS